MKNIALVACVDEREASERLYLASKVFFGTDARVLIGEKYRTVCSDFADKVSFLGEKELYDRADAVVALGGDGTFLTAAREAIPRGLPMVGVNFGHTGYMAELEKSEIDTLARILDDNYDIVERMTLCVDIISSSGTRRVSDCCLNEAVVSHGNISRIADIALYCDSEHVADHRADGIIVATPTGSTAYSMSAGGPILDPYMQCMCVTPVCPQSLTARPMLFGSESVLEIVNVCERMPSVYLTLDGRDNFEIGCGMRVKISRSEHTAKMISFGSRRFFEILKNKACQKNS